MLLREVARPRLVQAPASSQCRGLPAVPAPLSRCWWHPPKRTGKPEAHVRARWRRQKQSKTLNLEVQNSPKIKLKPEAVVEDQSKRGSAKLKSKPKVRVEAGSARRVGILDFNATVDCKCQEQNLGTLEKILKRILPYLQNVEYSLRISRLSWFQLRGLLEKYVD